MRVQFYTKAVRPRSCAFYKDLTNYLKARLNNNRRQIMGKQKKQSPKFMFMTTKGAKRSFQNLRDVAFFLEDRFFPGKHFKLMIGKKFTLNEEGKIEPKR